MSLVVLHHSDTLTLASSQRVIAANKLGTLHTMLEQAQSLSDVATAAESRISDSESQAREQGHKEGFQAGKEQGLLAAQKEVAAELLELNAAQALLQQQSTTMAFDIVRKLAATLDPAELLSALAITAAQSCDPDEQLVLRVHASYREVVAEKLAAAPSEISHRFTHVVGDAAIDTKACIIESSASRVLADLDTQTGLLEEQLANS